MSHELVTIGNLHVGSFAGPGGRGMLQLTTLRDGFAQLTREEVAALVPVLASWLEEEPTPEPMPIGPCEACGAETRGTHYADEGSRFRAWIALCVTCADVALSGLLHAKEAKR